MNPSFTELARSPLLCALFDDTWYLRRYPDAACALQRDEFLTALGHYLTTGVVDDRVATPFFDAEFYAAAYYRPGEAVSYQACLSHYLETGARAGYNAVPIFDESWYVQTYFADRRLPEDYCNGYHHYLANGANAGHNPSPLFDERWYRGRYPDATDEIARGLLSSGYADYILRLGGAERDPTPYFDGAWYRRQYHVVSRTYFHFLTRGAIAGNDPSPLFDAAWYRRTHAAAHRCIMEGRHPSGYHHYLYEGARQELAPSPYFMPRWYLDWYAPARTAVGEQRFAHAFEHYLLEGIRLQFSPNLFFEERYYRHLYPDVDTAVRQGRLRSGHQHFLEWGAEEGRQGSTVFDTAWYLDRFADARETIAGGLARNSYDHYCRYGLAAQKSPCEGFDEAWYREQHQEIGAEIGAGRWLSGLHHYVVQGMMEGYEPRPEPRVDPPAHSAVALECARRELKAFLAGNSELCLQPSPSPLVSLVLVLYNRAELTLRCLRSIASWAGVPYEVIVIDNHSRDDTSRLLAAVRGIHLIRNSRNRHFLQAANQGAAVAGGKYLLFLNNDAELQAGSLESAVAILENEPAAGAVGGKVILHNGALQEAGSYLLRNAFSAQYGRGQEPFQSEYMHRRDVPYCSGTFLLTPRQLFESLGGFDEAYYPAYCEDVDYCLRLWAERRRVIFSPDSLVLHHEGASSRHRPFLYPIVLRNIALLHARYRDYFATVPDYGIAPVPTLDGKRLRRAWLVLVDHIPSPDDTSAHAWMTWLRSRLEEQQFFTIYPLRPWRGERERAAACAPGEIELVAGKGSADLEAFCRQRAGIYAGTIPLCDPQVLRAAGDLDRWLPKVVSRTSAARLL